MTVPAEWLEWRYERVLWLRSQHARMQYLAVKLHEPRARARAATLRDAYWAELAELDPDRGCSC